MVPGSRALAFASRWFDPHTVSTVFEPLIADWHREWRDAGTARRRLISVRWSLAFISAILVSSPRMIVLTPAPEGTTRRVLARIVIFTGIVTMLLILPFKSSFQRVPAWQYSALLLSLVPQGMSIAFPLAMTWVADGIRRNRTATPAERVVAVRVGVSAMIVMIAFMGWVVPDANQWFREAVSARYGYRPARAIRETRTPDLIMEAALVGHPERGQWAGTRPEMARGELSKRAFFAALPALLLWTQWSAARAGRRRWYSWRGWCATIVVTVVLFEFLTYAGRMSPAGSIVGVWLPALGLLAWGLLLRGSPGGREPAPPDATALG
jgi:hypothetical protein